MPRKTHEDVKNIKANRCEEILRLIEEEDIGTQQDLMKRLNDLGYNITQGTVSRDIKELNLVKKIKPDGGYRYQANRTASKQPDSNRFLSLFRTTVISVQYALNQVVIKCYAGMADALCAVMDGMDWDGIIGTIAGDDTVLVITKSEEHARAMVEKFKNI